MLHIYTPNKLYTQEETKMTEQTKKPAVKALRLFTLSLAFILLMVVLQACGANNSNEKTSPSAGNSANPSESAAATGTSPEIKAPAVLNFGFVGSTKYTAGAEAWGIHTGIFLEEFKKYGVTEVNAIGFKIGPDLNEAVISGRVDFGSSGDTPAILNRAAGAKTRLIGQSDTELNSLIIVKNDGAKSLEELEGKTVAVVKGSIMHRYLVGTLEEKNVKNVKQISIGANTADALAALAKGEVDAVAATDQLVYKLLKTGEYRVLDTATDHPKLLATYATIVTDKYLGQFPDAAKVWNEAREKALADLQSKPEEYYQFVSESIGLPLEAVKELFPIDQIATVNFTDDGIIRAEESKRFLVEGKLAAQDFDLNAWILK
jgi:sulfonate transport system substrate-binding protein